MFIYQWKETCSCVDNRWHGGQFACKHIHFVQLEYNIVKFGPNVRLLDDGDVDTGTSSTATSATTSATSSATSSANESMPADIAAESDEDEPTTSAATSAANRLEMTELSNYEDAVRSECEALISALGTGKVPIDILKDVSHRLSMIRNECQYNKGFVKLPTTPANKKNVTQRMNYKRAPHKGEGVGRPKSKKPAPSVALEDVLTQGHLQMQAHKQKQ